MNLMGIYQVLQKKNKKQNNEIYILSNGLTKACLLDVPVTSESNQIQCD